jgi:predicted nucleic acid-binding protein
MDVITRIVLDTNVLVAAAYNAGSDSRRIAEACLHGELTAVLSPALRREYECTYRLMPLSFFSNSS